MFCVHFNTVDVLMLHGGINTRFIKLQSVMTILVHVEYLHHAVDGRKTPVQVVSQTRLLCNMRQHEAAWLMRATYEAATIAAWLRAAY